MIIKIASYFGVFSVRAEGGQREHRVELFDPTLSIYSSQSLMTVCQKPFFPTLSLVVSYFFSLSCDLIELLVQILSSSLTLHVCER